MTPTDLAKALRAAGAIDEPECCIDATFAAAKGGEQIGGSGLRKSFRARAAGSATRTLV
ncbi:MAG: hypothetical protein R3F58_01460 [Steroidobacteraceae bacterium]